MHSFRISTRILVPLLGGFALAAAVQAAERIEGRVAERFGNDLILETAQGRVLVRGLDSAPAPGQWIEVSGRLTEGRVDRARLVADASRAPDPVGPRQERQDPGRAPSSALVSAEVLARAQAEARRFGLSEPTRLEPRRRHLEAALTDPQGRLVQARFAANGQLLDYGLSRSERRALKRQGSLAPIDADGLLAATSALGFEELSFDALKRHHVELVGRRGAAGWVRVDVSLDGRVLRVRPFPEPGRFGG